MAEGDIDELVTAAHGEAGRQNFREWAGKARGMLAVVFTDIVDSTKLLVSIGDPAMEKIRVPHFTRSQELIEQNGGYEIKTIGDSVMAVFHAPENAFHYAQALRENPGHPRLFGRVRAGIHIGVMDITETDVFGVTVNYAARVIHSVEGPEIAVSVPAFDGLAASFGRDAVERDWSAARTVEMKGFGSGNVHFYSPEASSREPDVPTASAEAAKMHTESPSRSLPLPDKPWLAVLPFKNLTGDPEQDYFVEGVVEELILKIQQFKSLFVVSRDSSFYYESERIDIRRVARELGVRYILRGSVFKDANKVRIVPGLIDTSNLGSIPTEAVERRLDEILAVQQRLAANIAAAIEPKIVASEMDRVEHRRVINFDAWGYYLKARKELHKLTPEGIRQAIKYSKEALGRDGSYAPAAGLIAWCVVMRVLQGWRPSTDAEERQAVEALKLAELAIENGGDYPDVLWMAGIALVALPKKPDWQNPIGLTSIEQSLELNENSAHAWAAKGWVLSNLGRAEDAKSALERALRLSPYDPFRYIFKSGLALAQFSLMLFEDAMNSVDQSLSLKRDFLPSLRYKVALCGWLNDNEKWRKDGELYCERLSKRGYTISSYRADVRQFCTSEIPGSEISERIIEGLQRAGLPE